STAAAPVAARSRLLWLGLAMGRSLPATSARIAPGEAAISLSDQPASVGQRATPSLAAEPTMQSPGASDGSRAPAIPKLMMARPPSAAARSRARDRPALAPPPITGRTAAL